MVEVYLKLRFHFLPFITPHSMYFNQCLYLISNRRIFLVNYLLYSRTSLKSCDGFEVLQTVPFSPYLINGLQLNQSHNFKLIFVHERPNEILQKL